MDTPIDLQVSGRALWADVVGQFDLDPAEVETLAAAGRCVDELARLERALADGPVTVPGSKGQPVPNGLFAEVRAHRVVLARLLAQLALPHEEEQAGKTPASRHAQRAARSRWGQAAALADWRKQAANG